MNRVTAFVVVGVLALASAAPAQILTGNIIGTVKDATGAALPGVTVTLMSPALPGGPIAVVTTATGEYRFIQLDPGSYRLTATLDGFSTYQEAGLLVAVGGTTARDVTLKLAALAETITVSGESPMVDPRRFGVTTNTNREVLDVLPTKHDRIMEYGKWMPGVSAVDPSGDTVSLAVMGADTGENSLLIDGARQQSRGDPEAVEEIQVVTLGASAEYQVAQGGVFNAVTKSGTNVYKLDASAYWHPDALDTQPIKRPCRCDLGETGFRQPIFYDYGARLGGPIRRDRLWFYAGGNYFLRKQSNPGADPRLGTGRFSHGIIEKVTWRINDKLTLKQMFFNGIWENPDVPGVTQSPSGATLAAPHETLGRDGGRIFSTHATEITAMLSSTTLLTVRNTGTWNPNQYNVPLTGDYGTPIRRDAATGFACCGVAEFNKTEAMTMQQAVKLNQYVQGARTTHDLRVGVQINEASSWGVRVWPSGVQYSDLNGQPDQATFRAPSINGGQAYSQGVWAEDQMTFGGRVTVSLGVRFDRMKGVSQDLDEYNVLLKKTGATIKGLGDVFTWKVWAPRLGVNLKLTEDGKMTLRGSAGRAYRTVSTGDVSNVHPGIAPSTLTRWNPATRGYTTVVSVTDPKANLRIDSDMKAPFTDSYSIGVDRELRPNVAVGATYVYKRGENFIGWQDIGGVYGTRTDVLPDGRTVTVYPLLNRTGDRLFLRTNGPGTFSHYHGLVLTLDKRFSHRWQANLSYTRSRAEGLMTTGQDPNDDVNNAGRLSPQDRPNMVVATSTYDISRIGVQVSTSFMYMEGVPFAPQALINLPQGRRSVNVEAPGAYRFSSQELLAFRLTKVLVNRSGHRVLLSANLSNALQDTAEQTLATRNFFAANFAQPSQWIHPRRLYFQLSVR